MCLALLGWEPGCSAGGELQAQRHHILGGLFLRAQGVSKAKSQDLPQPGSSAAPEGPSPGPGWRERGEGHTPLCVPVLIPSGLAPKV